jgi:hypothetical protein
MYENKVYNKLVNLAFEEKSLDDFLSELKLSSESNPMRVAWETLEGNNRYYWMYWDAAAYKGGDAGGSSTKAKESMVNIQCLGLDGDWRTLDLSTVSKFRFEGKTYRVV